MTTTNCTNNLNDKLPVCADVYTDRQRQLMDQVRTAETRWAQAQSDPCPLVRHEALAEVNRIHAIAEDEGLYA